MPTSALAERMARDVHPWAPGMQIILAIAFLLVPVASATPSADFLQRVNEFLKLHKDAPSLKTTPDRQEIENRRLALARKIREARPNAKPGGIFSLPIAQEFRRIIGTAFQGSRSPKVRKTIQQGEPLQGWKLAVNGNYPDKVPETTIPPTLLRDLPRLPAEVEYRIVGHDFVLLDTRAMLIVDFIEGAVP